MTLKQDKYTIQVGLLWHSLRSCNLGVGALTLSNIAILRSAARRAGRDIALTVVGYGGPLHYSPSDGPVGEYLIRSSKDLLPGSPLRTTLQKCDVVLDIAAGDSWADIYGLKRFIWQWLSKEFVLASGRPLVFSPQTIGPFEQPVPRFLAMRTMRRASRIFSRDAESMQILRMGNCAGNAAQTADVAFRLPFTPASRAPEQRIKFGFNLSGLLYAGGYTGNDQFGSREAYRATVDGIIGGLSKRGDVDIVLVPHVVPNDGSSEDDVAVSRDLANRFAGVKVAPLFTSPVDAKTFISGLDVLAGSRMHATIAAASSGIAVVPLAYSRKFRGVFNSIGYPLVGDCTAQAPQDLIDLTLAAVDRRHELADAAKAGARRANDSLETYEAYLAQLFASI